MPIKILQTVAKVENSAQYCAKLKEKKAYVFVKFFASHGGGQSYTSQLPSIIYKHSKKSTHYSHLGK